MSIFTIRVNLIIISNDNKNTKNEIKNYISKQKFT